VHQAANGKHVATAQVNVAVKMLRQDCITGSLANDLRQTAVRRCSAVEQRVLLLLLLLL
jgi:hypothetical protein